MNKSDCMRTVHFRPYRKGQGPTFTLRLYYFGTEKIGYSFSMREKPNGLKVVIFEGCDFRPSPLHSIDSDDAVKGLMSFLTLRKGDTGAEYFDNYTGPQLEFSSLWAESLSCEVYRRFGD